MSNLFSCADIYVRELYADSNLNRTEDTVIGGHGTSGVTYPSVKLHFRADLLLPGDETARVGLSRGHEKNQERSGPAQIASSKIARVTKR